MNTKHLIITTTLTLCACNTPPYSTKHVCNDGDKEITQTSECIYQDECSGSGSYIETTNTCNQNTWQTNQQSKPCFRDEDDISFSQFKIHPPIWPGPNVPCQQHKSREQCYNGVRTSSVLHSHPCEEKDTYHPFFLRHTAIPITVTTSQGEAHQVTFTQDLIISTEEWSQCRSETTSCLPQTNITWFEAIATCNKETINREWEPCYINTEGSPYIDIDAEEMTTPIWIPNCTGYRLPTSTEWSLLTRGYIPASNTPRPNIGTNEILPTNEGEYRSLDLKIFHIHGNIREWVWDWKGEDLSQVEDPHGPEVGTERTIRGRSFLTPQGLYSNTFSYATPNTSAPDIGVRCVRSVKNSDN